MITVYYEGMILEALIIIKTLRNLRKNPPLDCKGAPTLPLVTENLAPFHGSQSSIVLVAHSNIQNLR